MSLSDQERELRQTVADQRRIIEAEEARAQRVGDSVRFSITTGPKLTMDRARAELRWLQQRQTAPRKVAPVAPPLRQIDAPQRPAPLPDEDVRSLVGAALTIQSAQQLAADVPTKVRRATTEPDTPLPTKRHCQRPATFYQVADAKESAAYKSNPGAVISAVFDDKGKAGPPFVVWDSADAFIDVTIRELDRMQSVADRLCLRPVYYMPDRPTSLYFDIDVSDRDLPRALGGAQPPAPSIAQLTEAFLAELQAFLDECGINLNVRREAWIFSKTPLPGQVAKASIHVHFPSVVAASVEVWRQLVTQHLRPWLYVRAISAHAADLPRGCLFIRKFDKKGDIHKQAWTAMDHSVYTKDRLLCPAGNGKPGRSRLAYDVALNAASGRAVPSRHDQILGSMSQSGVGAATFELPAHMRDRPTEGIVYRQCEFPYMLGAIKLGAKRSFGPDQLCGEALVTMNPLHRLFTASRYDSLDALKAADPVCLRYNGLLDLDAHLASPVRKEAFLQALRTKGIALTSRDFPEYAELIVAARDAQRHLTELGRRHLVYFSGAGVRVLWEDKALWMKCKYSELPSGDEVAKWMAAKFPPAVRQFIDAGPYKPVGGTKSDLQASEKTGLFASPLSDELPEEPQRTQNPVLARAIRSFWGRLLVTQPTVIEAWHQPAHAGQRPQKRQRVVNIAAPEELVALVAAEATRVAVDVPALQNVTQDTGHYFRLAYQGQRTCLAWRRTHSSNGGCLYVAPDGTVRVQCFSERCKPGGARIIGTIKVVAQPAEAARAAAASPAVPAATGHTFQRAHVVRLELLRNPAAPGKAYIHPLDLSSEPPRDIHVAAPKGAGKTFAIVQAIQQALANTPNLSVLIPAPRRSLGKAHYGELRQMGFVAYSETTGSLYQHNRVLVEYESLTRITSSMDAVRTYDLVVLDEPRCLIDALHSAATNRARIKDNFLTFLTVLRRATRVCTIDADLLLDVACPRLINWLSEVRPGVSVDLFVYPRATERVFAVFNRKTQGSWKAKFLQELRGPKLVTVCCETRKRADLLEAMALKHGLPAAAIRKYTSDTMPRLEDTLLDPDANGWLTCKLLLFTSTITVGVSSQRTGVLFAGLRHNTNNARLLEQMLSRVRNTLNIWCRS